MTGKDLGSAGVKLMGIFFGVSAAIRLLGLVATLVILPREEGVPIGFPSSAAMFRVNAMAILIELAIAGALVIMADSLADRLFSNHRLELAGLSRRDLLIGGLALVSISRVVSGAPGILQFAGKAVWFAQGSLQAQFLPSMERSWGALSKDVLDLVIGSLLLTKAARFGAALDRHYRRDAG